MRATMAVLAAAALLAVPGALGNHDRLDEEGDTLEATFVTGSLDGRNPDENPTTGDRDADPEYCSGTYDNAPVHNGVRAPLIVAGGLCMDLENDDPGDFGTFRLTVRDQAGNPVGFWWELANRFDNERCGDGGYEADGNVTFTTTTEKPDCIRLTSFFDQTAPAGTVTLERIG